MYSNTERIAEILQLLSSITFFGLLAGFSISAPLLNGTNHSLMVYYWIFLILFSIDLVSTILILFSSNDFEKHKYYRMNTGLLVSVLFVVLFFILPGLFLGQDITEFAFGIYFIYGLTLLKMILQVKIIIYLQGVYENMIELR